MLRTAQQELLLEDAEEGEGTAVVIGQAAGGGGGIANSRSELSKSSSSKKKKKEMEMKERERLRRARKREMARHQNGGWVLTGEGHERMVIHNPIWSMYATPSLTLRSAAVSLEGAMRSAIENGGIVGVDKGSREEVKGSPTAKKLLAEACKYRENVKLSKREQERFDSHWATLGLRKVGGTDEGREGGAMGATAGPQNERERNREKKKKGVNGRSFDEGVIEALQDEIDICSTIKGNGFLFVSFTHTITHITRTLSHTHHTCTCTHTYTHTHTQRIGSRN